MWGEPEVRSKGKVLNNIRDDEPSSRVSNLTFPFPPLCEYPFPRFSTIPQHPESLSFGTVGLFGGGIISNNGPGTCALGRSKVARIVARVPGVGARGSARWISIDDDRRHHQD